VACQRLSNFPIWPNGLSINSTQFTPPGSHAQTLARAGRGWPPGRRKSKPIRGDDGNTFREALIFRHPEFRTAVADQTGGPEAQNGPRLRPVRPESGRLRRLDWAESSESKAHHARGAGALLCICSRTSEPTLNGDLVRSKTFRSMSWGNATGIFKRGNGALQESISAGFVSEPNHTEPKHRASVFRTLSPFAVSRCQGPLPLGIQTSRSASKLPGFYLRHGTAKLGGQCAPVPMTAKFNLSKPNQPRPNLGRAFVARF
jgi:hypothetical protein